MAEANAEFGHAVSEVLAWLGASPDTAGALLGINSHTLNAMAQGIVPMRSIIIKFASGVARQCEGSRSGDRTEPPAWWKDVDAWLGAAGYSPRRDVAPNGAPDARPFRPPARVPTPPGLEPPPERRFHSPSPSGRPPGAPPPQPAAEGPRAREFYHPVYERAPVGDSFVHVFWIQDTDDRRIFKMTFAPSVDYKARAQQVKQDLAAMSKEQFERKYGRFRQEA